MLQLQALVQQFHLPFLPSLRIVQRRQGQAQLGMERRMTMNRLTTDNPAGNLSALMNYAYASENRVKLSYAGCTHGADLCEYIASEAAEFGLSCATLPA